MFDLETIEKVFVEKNNEKAKAGNAKASTASQKGASVPQKKRNGGGSGGPAPKKAKTSKYCKWCKEANGPYQTHNTSDCRRFDKDGKEVGKPHKPLSCEEALEKGRWWLETDDLSDQETREARKETQEIQVQEVFQEACAWLAKR